MNCPEMKIKLIVSVVTMLIGLFLLSCGDHKQPENNKTKTQAVIQDPLIDINNRIDKDSANADLYILRAKYYINQRKANQALKDINKAVHLDPENPANYVTLSDVYLMMGKIHKCREALEKAVKLDRKYQEAYLKLAELSLILQEYQNSFNFIDEVLQIDDMNPTAYFIRGYAFMEIGDTARAIESFRIAVDKDQNYYDAYIQLGLLLSAKKNMMAVDYFNNALNINPQSTEAYYLMGMFYQDNGKIQKAIDTYNNLIKIDPENKFAHYNLGYINLVYLNDFTRAIDYFTTVINLDSKYYDAFYNRGYCNELLGNCQRARQDYQMTLEIERNYQKAIDGLNRLDKVIVN